LKLILQIFKILRILGFVLGFSLIVMTVLRVGFGVDWFPYFEILIFYPNYNLKNVTEFPIGLPFFFIFLISAVKGDEIINYLESKIKKS